MFLVHFAVRDSDLRLGDALFDFGRALVDGFHTVVEIIDLPAAGKFTPDRLVENAVLVLKHKRLHRIAVLRRLFDGGHVTKPRQRHIERARDGRCG